MNLDGSAQKGRQKAFEHIEVGLVAQQALQSPVETDIGAFFHTVQ